MAENETTSGRDILIRVFWMMVGPLLLVILAYNIMRTGGGWFTNSDYGFLAVLAVIGLVRWLEFRFGHPRTASGEPATTRHLRRFLVGLALGGLIVWTAANVVGNYVLDA